MTRRIQRAWLNGVEFTDAHPALMLQHITEPEPKMLYKTLTLPTGGMIETGRVRERKEITLEFAIREGLDFVKRQQAYQAAYAWAEGGGWLELSDHLGQHIYVTLTTPPGLGQLRDWTKDIPMTFTAAWYPYWSDILPQTVSVSAGSTGTVTMTVLGNRNTCLEARIVPVSSALTTVVLATADSRMTLSLPDGSYVAANSSLVIDYDDRHLLRVYCGQYHLLQYRGGSDDLVLRPGMQTISYNFDVACNVAFASKGVWL